MEHQTSSEWLGLLVEAAPIAVLAADERGDILYANAELARLFGYEQRALLGTSVEALMPERVRHRHAQHRAHYTQSPHVRRMGSGMNLVAQRADGSEFPIEAGLNYININGELIVITSITDISVQQRASEELERQVAVRTQEIQHRQQVAEALSKMVALLNTEQTLDTVHHYIAREACRLLRATASAFCQPRRDGLLAVQASENLALSVESCSVRIAETLLTAPDAAQPLFALPTLYESTLAPDVRHTLATQGHRALLGMPLRSNRALYGILLLYYDEPQTFGQAQMQVASAFANEATLALENAQLRLQAQATAVTNERNRIARDLHDSVTQTLFSASLIAEVLPLLWARNREEGERRLHELRNLARGALAEMRTLLLELRPATLVEMPLPDLLAQLVEGIRVRASVAVDLRVEGGCELPAHVKIAFFHVAQEALNNVAKHAVASRVDIALACGDEGRRVSLAVHDNGVGFHVEQLLPRSLGIKIMRERAEEIDAVWHIESAPGAGTTVTLDWQAKGANNDQRANSRHGSR